MPRLAHPRRHSRAVFGASGCAATTTARRASLRFAAQVPDVGAGVLVEQLLRLGPGARQVLGVRSWPKPQVLQYLLNDFAIRDTPLVIREMRYI
jgi:hypothetical protein